LSYPVYGDLQNSFASLYFVNYRNQGVTSKATQNLRDCEMFAFVLHYTMHYICRHTHTEIYHYRNAWTSEADLHECHTSLDPICAWRRVQSSTCWFAVPL